jgi:hypothetical protein
MRKVLQNWHYHFLQAYGWPGQIMVIYRPPHAQLRNPLLNVEIDDAAHAQTLWEVHFVSFRDLLRRVAVAQRFRWPERIVAFPPERAAFPIAQCPYGFQLLVVRHVDLAIYLPELASYPTQVYPARPLRGGASEQVLVVDGWSGIATGLLRFLPHVMIQLEGTLGGIQEAAWDLLNLGLGLDGSIWIREVRGGDRARLDKQGWTSIWAGTDQFRSASGIYREGSPSLDTPKGPGTNSGEEQP